MLVNLNPIFKIAKSKKIAIGAFNVTSFESADAVVSAAEVAQHPVILNYAPVHGELLSFDDAAEIMLYHANKASVPVCVHLDHGVSFEICIQAIRKGFSSVMIDASASNYEDNILETKAVVRAAHAVGVTVEAELGHIFSSDIGIGEGPKKIETADNCGSLDNIYTDPEVAKDFVKKTGVDCLAIAFGTSHGLYVKKPVLDLDRISRIREKVSIPLVMHGGSGLSKEEFQTAIKNGIRKVNYYTYMALSGGKAVREELKKMDSKDHLFYHDLPIIGKKAMKEDALQAIKTFSLEV